MTEVLPPPVARPRRSDLRRARRRFGGRSIGPSPVGKLKRRWPKRVLVGVLSLVVLIGLGGVGVYIYARYRFDQLHKAHVSGLVARIGNEPFNILLVGSDSRAFVDSAAQTAAFGSAQQTTGQRSDVIILARIVPATHQVKLLSIPRDTFVDIPGHVSGVSGPNRINAAYNDGPSLLVETIEKTFHVPITYYAEVNFPGFEGMVNALGGIGLDFPDPVRDAYSGLDITTTGCQLVNGTQALALVRSRHLYYYSGGSWLYDGNSDFSRIQRQDAFFRAVVSKLKGAVSNPFTLNSFVSSATKYVTIDQTLSEGTLFDLARMFRGFSSSELATETLPTIEAVIGGADVLVPAPAPDEQMLNAFLAFGSTPAKSTAARTDQVAGTAELTAAVRAVPQSSGSGSVTVTTLPGSPASGPVVYNTSPEPWNPTPCTP